MPTSVVSLTLAVSLVKKSSNRLAKQPSEEQLFVVLNKYLSLFLICRSSSFFSIFLLGDTPYNTDPCTADGKLSAWLFATVVLLSDA